MEGGEWTSVKYTNNGNILKNHFQHLSLYFILSIYFIINKERQDCNLGAVCQGVLVGGGKGNEGV
jgi:hypothetical protein